MADGVVEDHTAAVVATKVRATISSSLVAHTAEATAVAMAVVKAATASMRTVVMAVVAAATGEATLVREAPKVDMAEAAASLPVTLGQTRALPRPTLHLDHPCNPHPVIPLPRPIKASNPQTVATEARPHLVAHLTRFSSTT